MNFLVQNDSFPNTLIPIVESNRSKIENSLKCVGVIKVKGVTDYLGTGWFINNKVLVTNAHVIDSKPIHKLEIDLKNEHNNTQRKRYNIVKRHIVDTNLDIAFLEISSKAKSVFKLSSSTPVIPHPIVIIGYPELSTQGSDFYKKHLHSGQVTANSNEFTHNCLTFDGNSGSPVIDIQSGNVIGLHYKTDMKPLTNKYAIKVEHIIELAKKIGIKTH